MPLILKKTESLRPKHYIQTAFLLLLLLCFKPKSDPIVVGDEVWFAKNCKLTKNLDTVSNTYYFLTRIKHKDTNGKLIKLRMALSNKAEGETVRDFAIRMNTELAFNGSTANNLSPTVRQAAGIQIIDGVIVQELAKKAYTLGIKDDNELLAYQPGTKAADILKDGAHTALTAFIPLIENHRPVSEELFKLTANLIQKNPRQVIAQFDNKDILFLSCGGRGFDGDGMTVMDVIRVLKALNVRFAFNLDGGGSTSTVIGDKLITKKIDGKGTLERLRPNFLYFLKN